VASNMMMVMALWWSTWTGGKGRKEGRCAMRLEEEQGTEGKPKAGGDRCFLYCAAADEGGRGLVIGVPPHIKSWGVAQRSGRPTQDRGQWVRADGGTGVLLRHMPAQTVETRGRWVVPCYSPRWRGPLTCGP
jgi:hypothetical protein